jgi:hypothetical protein
MASRASIYGSLLQRMIYHYWYHTGENATIRQNLGHTALPTSSAISTRKRLAPAEASG